MFREENEFCYVVILRDVLGALSSRGHCQVVDLCQFSVALEGVANGMGESCRSLFLWLFC